MAFPSVVARTPSEQTSDADSFTVGLGSPSAGELIVAIISCDSAANTNDPPWQIEQGTSGKNWWAAAVVGSNSAVVGIVAIKVASGSDALKILFTNASAQQASAITFRISGHGSYAAVASAIGNSTNGDPPNVAISGSAQDCLFIAGLCTDAQVVATGAPSGYSNLTTKTATNSTGASVSVADKTANATSDNPGTFTNTTEQWVAFSIAIPSVAITTNARATQVPLESVSQTDPNLVATQLAVEALSSNFLNLICTQLALEVLTPQTQELYVTQVALEVISIREYANVTQVALEVLSGDPWASNRNKYRQIQIAC